MPAPAIRREGQRFPNVSIWFLILSNILVFQFGGYFFGSESSYSNVQVGSYLGTQSTAFGSSEQNPLGVPNGKAVALPSVRVNDDGAGYDRKMYGGKGDKPHLGGFATGSVDIDGMSPALWKWMIQQIGVKSLLDVCKSFCVFVWVRR